MSSPQHEPTMEEILASIRKIISEDAPEAVPAAEAAAAHAEPASGSRRRAGLLTAPEEEHRNEVLELTQEVTEDTAGAGCAPEPAPNLPPEVVFEVVFESRARACRRNDGIFSDQTRQAMDDTLPRIADQPLEAARRRPVRAPAFGAGRTARPWKTCSSAPCARASSRCMAKYLCRQFRRRDRAHEALDPRMDGRAFPGPAGRRGAHRSRARGKGPRPKR